MKFFLVFLKYIMEQDKYIKSHRQSRKDKSKDKSNNFFGSQKHIRIKTNIIEKLRKK